MSTRSRRSLAALAVVVGLSGVALAAPDPAPAEDGASRLSEVTAQLDEGLRRGVLGLPATARGLERWGRSALPRPIVPSRPWTFGTFDPTAAGLPAFLCCAGRHTWGRGKHTLMQSPIEDASTVGRQSRRGIYRFHQPMDR